MYTLEEIWDASLLIVPVQISHHWILMAVTNPSQALSQESSPHRVHDEIPGELKPDSEPFTILLLNSAPQFSPNVVTKLPAQMKRFLELTWLKLRLSSLEFVNWYEVKVRQLEEPHPQPTYVDASLCSYNSVLSS